MPVRRAHLLARPLGIVRGVAADAVLGALPVQPRLGDAMIVQLLDPLLRRIKYETGAFVALYKPYAERYIGLLSDLLENPPDVLLIIGTTLGEFATNNWDARLGRAEAIIQVDIDPTERSLAVITAARDGAHHAFRGETDALLGRLPHTHRNVRYTHPRPGDRLEPERQGVWHARRVPARRRIGIERDVAVRVGPLIFRDDAVKRDRAVVIEHGEAVMRLRGGVQAQSRDRCGDAADGLTSHDTLLAPLLPGAFC